MLEVEEESATDGLRESKETNNIKSCNNCGKACDPYDKPALNCSGGCNRKIHIKCLKRGSVPTPFVGDVFFEFNCASCSQSSEETVIRDKMPWLNVIVLTLYNLREKSSGISNRGYFHWKSDISTFVDKHWDVLFKKSIKKKKNWTGTISGTLSHYGGIFFKSGTIELKESGWWKLMHTDPPEILIARNNKVIQDRKKNLSTKLSGKSSGSPAQSDSSISIGEDSNCGRELIKQQSLSSLYCHVNVQPTDMLSDFVVEDNEPHDLSTGDNIMLSSKNHVLSIFDLISDHQYEDTNFLTRPTDDYCEWLCNMSPPWLNDTGNEDKNTKEEEYDEDSNESSVSIQEQPIASLFKETSRRKWPWSKRSAITGAKIPRMTRQEEVYLLQKVNKTDLDKASHHVRRLYRKLAVRKTKREYGLPLLDVDCLESESGASMELSKNNDRVLDRFFVDDLGSIFEQRLQGYSEPTAVHSPYTNRLLKPFIRRDTCSQPLWLKIMEEVCMKANQNNPEWKPSPRAPIDYSYVKPQHIPAINSLCNQFFWPGIDLTECLQYPDFTCVVLYKKLVIGFAVLVPDVGYNEAYISFILTRPEWRKVGIGTFMLYHLIQTCMGRDVTLHVSATNPAVILYQKFSFKVEEFVQDFYDKYMPPSSRECRHALYLRLNR
ncbi:PREDICTED: cysteine-rich protein 2-binding protein isoform X2 [Dinoponera quadriceps]|uniref:Cysteine-rich protein 2-binding protein isoform X2 n=1 Tax=Dinoponera quadriceps TaxID=609295 RepID=A0A6P3WUN2_DINQU|nr:PREDICTED: cysteine-rich protein 2-binding protein isoform X2 [Dinoponera quadriceps]